MHAFALTDEIRTAFNGVQLLLPGFEVEFLDICQHTDDERRHAYEDAQRLTARRMHTSVSIAKPGFQFSGGIILQMPNCDASGAIFFIYRKGSLNSSMVGRYVGASCRPCGRILFVVSRLAVGCPLRSTLDRSRGADFMALKCTGAGVGL